MVIHAKGQEWLTAPEVLPGGETVLFSAASGPGVGTIEAASLRTAERRVLAEAVYYGARPRYLPTGHLVYAQEGTIWAAPFSPDRLEMAAPPVPVVEGVMHVSAGVAQFEVSHSGSLVYVPGSAGPSAKEPFVPVDCSSIPAGLLESELFGHVKGAFTGADADSPGLFRSAKRGTVFLDAANAWSGEFRLEDMKTAAGVSLGLDTAVGYALPFTAELTVAHGFDELGETKLYFRMGLAF